MSPTQQSNLLPQEEMTDLQRLKQAHQLTISRLIEQFLDKQTHSIPVSDFLRSISDATDSTLKQLWQTENLPAGIALVAVGGYGRAELFPYSDVDILILLPDQLQLEAQTPERSAIENFIRKSWDLGLIIGSSVRTIQECLAESQKDITVQTALLESRLIIGEPLVYQEFRERFFQQMEVVEFTQSKLREMRRRHQKYDNSPYSLEPNCKESPGGLRDIHLIFWITQAAQLGNTWDELIQKNILTEREKEQIVKNELWLKQLRTYLHLQAKRHEDRLIFDLQEEVAKAMGYLPTKAKRASEVLMHHYYRTAQEIAYINQIFILSISEYLLDSQEAISARTLSPHFTDRAGTLDIVDEEVFQQHPDQILQVFLTYAQNEELKTLSLKTFRALHEALDLIDDTFRADPINHQTFLEVLKASPDVYQAFRLMNQTGVLGRYLPVFQKITGLMQHDLFHVYTVDQHTLLVLRNLRRFFTPEHAHEYPLCSDIAAGFDRPWLLYIAALFHDIAKGRQGDHSRLGAQEVAIFAANHSLSRQDTELLTFLVSEHLTMSDIAQKKDFGDPEVIHDFIATVQTKERLDALYLLTVADIRGTSPKVWNSWKAHLLEQLYKLTLHMLGGHIDSPWALVNMRKKAALEELSLLGFQVGREERLWQSLNISYFLRHVPQEIAWHTEMLWEQVGGKNPTVYAQTSKSQDRLQVLVYTPDQPDLFARICSFFSATNLNIVDARIHTTTPSRKEATRWALDTFQLIPAPSSDGGADLHALEKLITQNLQKTLEQKQPLPPLRSTRSMSRRARYFPFPPLIHLQPDETKERWILSITTGDRIGLLYAIAKTLSQMEINLELAKISTLGDRVEDTFLISSPALESTTFQEQLEKALLEAIEKTAL